MSGLIPDPPVKLSGDEYFSGSGATVLDFWRWAMPDLRMNNVRGYLAEFLVARAVGANNSRVEWDAYDVLSPAGTRIEVKSRGYLQSWPQPGGPAISPFTVSATMGWDHSTGTYLAKGWHADVYVFSIHTAQDHSAYDVLDVDQWDFYVLPRSLVVDRGGRSMSLSWLQEALVGPTMYADLGSTIEAAHAAGEVEGRPSNVQPSPRSP